MCLGVLDFAVVMDGEFLKILIRTLHAQVSLGKFDNVKAISHVSYRKQFRKTLFQFCEIWSVRRIDPPTTLHNIKPTIRMSI